MSKYAFWLYVGAVLIASLSQILLKLSANKQYCTNLKAYINGTTVISYGLFILSIVMVTLALKKIEYKYGTIIESTSYFFVLMGSAMILKEKITKKKVLGVIVVFIGIVIFIA